MLEKLKNLFGQIKRVFDRQIESGIIKAGKNSR
jgi:hypothetical protein